MLEDKIKRFNKYNLTLDEIKAMRVNPYKFKKLREQIDPSTNYIMINRSDALGYNEFFVKIYEVELGHVSFYSDYGMTKYNFNEFFNYNNVTTENMYDIEIQEIFLNEINKLIDLGVLYNERIYGNKRLDKAMDILDKTEELPSKDVSKERPKLENGDLIIASNNAKYIVFGGIGYSLSTKKPIIHEEDIDNNYCNTKNPSLSIKSIFRIPMNEILENINEATLVTPGKEIIYEREDLIAIQGRQLNSTDGTISSWIDTDSVAKDAEIGDFAIVKKKDKTYHIEITNVVKTKAIDNNKKVLELIKIER